MTKLLGLMLVLAHYAKMSSSDVSFAALEEYQLLSSP
jgi:hypothetical protein